MTEQCGYLPWERRGERRWRSSRTSPGGPVTADELIEHLRPQLTKIKLPVAVHLVEALPRNPVGKIDKPALHTALTGV